MSGGVIVRRRPELPDRLQQAWRGFLDCAELIEGARRTLLGTLPVGRLDPAPVGVGLDAVEDAVRTVRAWMPRWQVDELEDDWGACRAALDEAAMNIGPARRTAVTTTELEELLGAVEEVVAPLDAFADAEAAWRARWRVPRERP